MRKKNNNNNIPHILYAQCVRQKYKGRDEKDMTKPPSKQEKGFLVGAPQSASTGPASAGTGPVCHAYPVNSIVCEL